MAFRIPLAQPEITDADRNAVFDVLNTPWLSMGPKLTAFEQSISEYVKSPFAVAVNSGTSALHLAFKILDISEGAEVILPSFAFIAPLNVVLQERLRPVFVDINPQTFNVEPEVVEAAITSRTKAIVAIHTFGRPLRVDTLREIADQHDIALIEDACEALGAEVNGQKAGTFGDVAALAFYPNKQITTGEGGILLTRHERLAERAQSLRNQGRNPALDWLQHTEVGFSYRVSEMNCALGIEQVRRIESTIIRREALAQCYGTKLRGISGIATPGLKVGYGRISWFCYVIQFGKEIDRGDRDWIARSLATKGIETGKYFAPLHRQPIVAALPNKPDLPVTDHVSSRTLALPFFNQMTEADVEKVCNALSETTKARTR
jgi:perosamine synthetase